MYYVLHMYLANDNVMTNKVGVEVEQRGLVNFDKVFFYYGQKNIFVDLHVSGNSKTFSPL